MQAAGHAESGGVEFEHREVGEDILVRVEEGVVVDAAGGPENPLAIGPIEGLGGFALDLIAQAVLALVGFRQHPVGKQEHARAEQCGHGQHGNRQPVEADPGGFNRGDLVGFGQQPEVHQGCHQNAERQHQVNNLGKEIAVIIHHHAGGNLVANDVTQNLEEIEDDVDAREGDEEDDKIEDPAADDVDIQDLQESPADFGRRREGRRGAGEWLRRARQCCQRFTRSSNASWRNIMRVRTWLRFESMMIPARANRTLASQSPMIGETRPCLAKLQPEGHQDVVHEKQQEAEHHAQGLAALARGNSQRDAHQRQDDGRHRQGKAVMQLHQGGLAIAGLVNALPKLGEA